MHQMWQTTMKSSSQESRVHPGYRQKGKNTNKYKAESLVRYCERDQQKTTPKLKQSLPQGCQTIVKNDLDTFLNTKTRLS